jgi:spore maturation protein B
MTWLLFFSDLCIPLVIAVVIGSGLAKKQPVYDQFVTGAKAGMRTVAEILPTLVGLMMGVGVLRASGFLDAVSACISPLAKHIGLPGEIIPLTLVKMFSSSAATGLLLDIYEQFGPDSFVGRVASVQLSCTETIFYTVSVYCLATGTKEHAPVKNSCYTIPGALFATAVGVVMSVAVAGWM